MGRKILLAYFSSLYFRSNLYITYAVFGHKNLENRRVHIFTNKDPIFICILIALFLKSQ